MKTSRDIVKVITGTQASDGNGVQLTRIIGSDALEYLDPFLLLDAFGSNKPQDYIGGFPPHPHRGFETVTYMLAGKMRHEDNVGNTGVIEAGDVQWMRAGKGVIHSEMPEQEEGLLAGFQLWVNLPASHKMVEPEYQEIANKEIPFESRDGKCTLKVIAGKTIKGTKGVIQNDLVMPVYWDVLLNKGTTFEDNLPALHNAFIYLIEGELKVGHTKNTLQPKELGVLSLGDQLDVTAQEDSRFLLIAGKPIHEPVARGGPFVMNTQEEIKQAFADYQSGQFV